MRPVGKKCRHFLVVAAVSAGLGGCTVLYEAPDRLARIPAGASKVQVSAALGAPDRIVSAGNRETWLYCSKGAVLDRFILAEFDGPALLRASRHTEFEFGACVQFFERYKVTSPGG